MSLWSRLERRLEDLAGELLPDETRDQVAAARDALARGDAADAADRLAAVVTARPAYTAAITMLGTAHLELGRANDALAAFDAALALRSDLPEGLLGRGEALLALGHLVPARLAFRAAIDAAAGEKGVLSGAYRGLGLVYLARGDHDKAIRELRKAVAETPDDPDALTALGGALTDAPVPMIADGLRYLRRAVQHPGAGPAAWLALGRAELAADRNGPAADAFAHALERGAAEVAVHALAGLGDAALASGDADGARIHYQHAIELAPRRGDLQARIGHLDHLAGDDAAALARFESAVRLGADPPTLRRALDIALASGPTAARQSVDIANQLLEHDPDDPRALTARALDLARAGQLDAARATLRAASARGDDPEIQLALGQIAAREGAASEAVRHAWVALRLRPRDRRARQLLADARRAESRGAPPGDLAPAPEGVAGEPPATDASDDPLYRLALDLQHLVGARPALAELVHDVAQAAADFDQPLLVTVMGEFSSGKSTFINALVRDDIAPVGITPTTATINVVKYGRERGGRVLYRDGRVLTLPWPALSATLRALDGDAAREVASVEILYPLAELERVSIVDTPGLNSILPEHEQVARDFIARADAIVWLFSAGQAGKASEREALAAIRGEGKRVLGVLNKTDQLSERERSELVAHVSRELGELVEVVIPLSARQALDARRRDANATEGNWGELSDTLEARFFSRARELKRQACDRRLAALIAEARRRIDHRREVSADAGAALTLAADAARAELRRFESQTVPAQRRVIGEGMAHLYRAAAREVLELVRPRRLPFGTHRAAIADRDYLLGLLDAGFSALLAPVRDAVTDEIHRVGIAAAAAVAADADVVGGEHAAAVEQAAREAARLVEARVFARADAFVRGYLRGGVVDRFFQRDLPRLALSEDAVYHALYRDAPDVDAEIAEPLRAAGGAALSAIAERIDRLAGLADAMAFDLASGDASALAELERRRQRA